MRFSYCVAALMDGRLALPSFNDKRLADPALRKTDASHSGVIRCRTSTACTLAPCNAHHRDHCQGVTYSARRPASSPHLPVLYRSPDRREIRRLASRRLGGTRLKPAHRIRLESWNRSGTSEDIDAAPQVACSHDNRAIDRHQRAAPAGVVGNRYHRHPRCLQRALTAIPDRAGGFDALYVSGAAISAARGPARYRTDFAGGHGEDAAVIANAVTIPVIVDADTDTAPLP